MQDGALYQDTGQRAYSLIYSTIAGALAGLDMHVVGRGAFYARRRWFEWGVFVGEISAVPPPSSFRSVPPDADGRPVYRCGSPGSGAKD